MSENVTVQSDSLTPQALERHARQHGLEDYYRKYPQDLERAGEIIARSRAALIRIEVEIASSTPPGDK